MESWFQTKLWKYFTEPIWQSWFSSTVPVNVIGFSQQQSLIDHSGTPVIQYIDLDFSS